MADREDTVERGMVSSGEDSSIMEMKLLVENRCRRDEKYAEECEWLERERTSQTEVMERQTG